MDLRDRQLDDIISYGLENGAYISTAQKRAAWDKLRAAIDAENALSQPAAGPGPTWRDRIMRLGAVLLTDEAPFHRAAVQTQPVYNSCYYSWVGVYFANTRQIVRASGFR